VKKLAFSGLAIILLASGGCGGKRTTSNTRTANNRNNNSRIERDNNNDDVNDLQDQLDDLLDQINRGNLANLGQNPGQGIQTPLLPDQIAAATPPPVPTPLASPDPQSPGGAGGDTSAGPLRAVRQVSESFGLRSGSGGSFHGGEARDRAASLTDGPVIRRRTED
jgi:hypothetical protein